MRRTLSILAGLMICCIMPAQSGIDTTAPRWLRQNSISPDGGTVAFVYQGDIFTVPVTGGLAKQLTTNAAHDTEPLWSPDGKWIVFSSVREGSMDIWAMPSDGGTPYRLTTYGGKETPLTVAPDGTLYFSANIQEDPVATTFPGDNLLYSLNFAEALEAAKAIASGDRSTQLPTPTLAAPYAVCAMSVNTNSTVLYEDWKGYEDSFRKHHTSAVTHDVWLNDGGTFTKLSTYVGENRNPVWAPDGKAWYYLSEKRTGEEKVDDWGGDSNIWRVEADGSQRQVTHFEGNPVRYMSVASDGTICFSYNGDLYTMAKGAGEPVKIDIRVTKDRSAKEHIWRAAASGAGSLAISPDGKEIAIVVKGDVYVTTLGLDDTRRITDTPEQERGVSFGKDGRSLYYASERDGEWGIYRTVLNNKDDKYFTFSYDTSEERVSPKGQTCFQPVASPDGKKVAWLRDRTEIVVADADGGNPKSLLKGANFSYSDGDLPFEWSPDSRHILTTYQGGGRMYNEDIALIDVESGQLTDLTLSGYSDVSFRWALGGKAMTWETDRAGYRSHGSWGAEGDVYAMFFDDEAFMKFRRSEDVEKIEDLLQSDRDKKKEARKEEKDSTKAAKGEVEPLKLELSRRDDRTVRLTPSSGRLGDHLLTPDGDKLYYAVQLEKGQDLCCLDLRKGDVKVVKKGISGGFYPSPDGKGFFVLSPRGIEKIDYASGKGEEVTFKGEYEYFPDKEREYIFEHCWKQVKEKFYAEDLHGVDWAAVRENYRQFLPYITDNYAFQELLSEMLGELNGSHTGGRYRDGSGIPTGHIGVLFDETYTGKGLKIREFLPESRLLAAAPDLKEGDLILSVNGKEIPQGQPWYDALSRLAGKRTLLGLSGGRKAYVTPTASDQTALYKRWVRRNEEKVTELSGGRIGYVHVEGMNSPSFREVYSKALGKWRDCDALIVDTRHNGGGWLHNDLANFLNGRLYTERRPRGVEMSPEPYDKWIKPSCVIVCEDNYSDACGFPYVYRSLGIGKIIGSPVAGTATSVWWETQIDPTLVFGIPQIGSWSVMEGRFLENDQLEPDILVYNDPASVMAGEDRQLEAAVAEMLKEVSK